MRSTSLHRSIRSSELAPAPPHALVISYELLMPVIRSSPRPVSGSDIPIPEPPAGLNGHGHAAAELFAAELSRGKVPGIRRIRKVMHLGQPRAQRVREYLAALADQAPPINEIEQVGIYLKIAPGVRVRPSARAASPVWPAPR